MERVEVVVSEIASVPDLSSVATSTPDTIALDLSTTDRLSTTYLNLIFLGYQFITIHCTILQIEIVEDDFQLYHQIHSGTIV